MEFEFLEEEQLTLVCPRRTDDDASSGAIGAAWRVPRTIAETLAEKYVNTSPTNDSAYYHTPLPQQGIVVCY